MNSARRRPSPLFSSAVLCALAVVVGTFRPAGARAADQESWDAIYMGSTEPGKKAPSYAKVGHIHTYIEPVKDKKRDLLRVRVDTVLNFRRGRDIVTNKLQYGTIETLDGSVLRLDTRTLTGEREIRVYGDVIDGKMNLVLDAGGERQTQVLDWGPDVRGPYAAEMSLSRAPMKVGDTRDLKMFVPELNRICDITLSAVKKEDVVLGDGEKHDLLRIEQSARLDGKPKREFDTTMWIDDSGQVIKSAQDLLGGMVVYRTTKAGALAPDRGTSVDRIAHSVIKVPSRIPESTNVRSIRYRVELPGDDLSQLLPNDRRQTLTTQGDEKSKGTLDVKTAGPEAGTADTEELSGQFLRPNPLVTSDDPEVRALAQRAVGNASTPWDKAVKIEHWVFENLKNKNFATTFAPASEVARSLSGDCTEHSVLAAAMCRAVGLPSRVAVGLVYAENLGGFGFHMWHEVHVNGRWVALDSSFDESAVDATHIKLTDTSLQGVAPFEAFLPIVRVMGKLTITPVEVR